MKLQVEYNNKLYVARCEKLDSMEQLNRCLKKTIQNLDFSKVNVQYFDNDFQVYCELTSVKEIQNLMKLKIVSCKSDLGNISQKVTAIQPKKISLHVECNNRSYVIKCDALKSVEHLKSCLEKNIEHFNSSDAEIQYMDPDFQEYCEILTIDEIKNLTKLKVTMPTVALPKIEEKPSGSLMETFKNYTTKLFDEYPGAVKEEKTNYIYKLQDYLKNMLEAKPSQESESPRSTKRKLDEPENAVKRFARDTSKNLLAAGALPNFLPEKQANKEIEWKELTDFMKKEIQQPNPREDFVRDAMRKTLIPRRHDVVRGQLCPQSLYEVYPCLFREGEVLDEFTRICNEKIDLAGKITKNFIQIGEVIRKWTKNNDTLENDKMDELLLLAPRATNKEYMERLRFNISLVGLPLLLNESYNDIFTKQDGCSTTRISIHYRDTDPYLELDPKKSKGVYEVCINGSHIKCTSRLDAFCVCFASHYVFNMSYPEKLFNFFTFIEAKIFGLRTRDGPPQLVNEVSTKLRDVLQNKCHLY